MQTHTYKKKLLSVLIIPMAALCMTGCENHDEPDMPPPAIKESERTILVYMVSNNNLGAEDFDNNDIKEMVKAASSAGGFGNSRVLIFHKYRYREQGTNKIAVQLNEIKPYGLDTLMIYDNDDYAVSKKRMREVIDDVKRLSPAKSYGMVFWSHASGWLQDGIEEDDENAKTGRSFGYDDYGNPNVQRMNITSLHDAIYDASLDFIYFDCCYMGSVETVYELRDCAPYIICSPCEIPAAGMPYHTTLPILADTGLPLENMAIKAATNTFNTYNDIFRRGDCPNTLAVVRTDKLDVLAAATRRIYEKAIDIYNPTYDYQRFSKAYTCYYYDFEHYIESISEDEADMEAWRRALADAVVYAEASPWIWNSIPVERYSGLSTYIHTSENSITTKNYNTLSWYADVASALFE